MAKLIKVFGERNTATRALKAMLRSDPNLSVHLSEDKGNISNSTWADMHGRIRQYYRGDTQKIYFDALRETNIGDRHALTAWKHSAPVWDRAFVKGDIRVIFTIKNPYSWALSMARKPYHMKAQRTGSFDTFIDRPWLTERRDNLQPLLPSVINLWNEKLRAYRQFEKQANENNHPTAFLHFENFIADPVGELKNKLHSMGLGSGNLKLEPTSTKKDGRSLEDIQNYYLDETWKLRLKASSVEIINNYLDPEMLEHFGYSLLNYSDFPTELDLAEQKKFSYEMLNLNSETAAIKLSKLGG